MKPPAAVLLLGSLLALGGAGRLGAAWPDWMERWLFNPRERTEQARGALARGVADRAIEPLEAALRLDERNPVAMYNAGTGRLAAGLGDATELLETAAGQGAGDLVPIAHYNLGNARMSADDLPGAIDAFEDALRRDPELAAAKFNLELAQRLLKEEQEQEQKEQQDEENQEQQDQQQQQDQEQDQEEQQEEQEQDPQNQEQPPQPGEQDQDQEQPLPQFRDLPDMSAAEAAAILEAVENMERERRRQKALEAAKVNARGKKDW